MPTLVEAFLIVEQPRQRLGHWTKALAPLDYARAPALAGVVAYYDPSCDQALIGLRYDALALGGDGLQFVVEVALLAEIGMIQPAELSDGDRRRFLGERLASCSLQVADQRNVVGTLTELVRRIREQKQARLGAAAPGMAPRPTQDEVVLLVQPKGTRDNLSKPRTEGSQPLAPVTDELATARVARPAATIVPRSALRTETAEMPPEESIRRVAESLPAAPMPQGIIYARFLRSGRWVPVRIGALSLKGAALITNALPRAGDHVDLALSFSDFRALVRGPVTKVSSTEEVTSTGVSSFSVTFELDEPAKRQLTSLLTAARAAQVTIKPPPSRTTRRYPVEWPVALGTPRGAIRAEALDISTEGMFVRPIHPLALDASVNFSVVLEDGVSAPTTGRAKVVRHVSDKEARTCGLSAGYGLKIVEMAPLDRERWEQFVTRISKRAEKRVLVGAAPGRLSELQAALVALGYAVSGGTDPGALVQLAGADRAVDAVLLDGGWLETGAAASWIHQVFSARNVPCITMLGDARRGRAAIDRLLTVC